MAKTKNTVKSKSFNFTVINSEHKSHHKIMQEMTSYLNKTKFGYWDGYGGRMGRETGFDQFCFVKENKYSLVVSHLKKILIKNRATPNYKIWKEDKVIYDLKENDFNGSSIS